MLTRFGFCRQIFIKVSNKKFGRDLSSVSRVDTNGGKTEEQTGGHDEDNVRCLRLRERA
jgi:hypothetical protein